MSYLIPSSASSSPLSPVIVFRVGFAGKRDLDVGQTETVRNRLFDVFSTIGWRLGELAPKDDAVHERSIPSIDTWITQITAVLLAAWRLVLMGKTSTQLTEWVQSAANIAHISQPANDSAKKSSDFALWVFPVLLALAALKLWIVVFIFRSAHAAIHGDSSSSIQKSKIENYQSLRPPSAFFLFSPVTLNFYIPMPLPFPPLFFPASNNATSSFNGLHPQGNILLTIP